MRVIPGLVVVFYLLLGLLSHAVALGSHELSAVARSCEVGVLVSLGPFFASTHLALVKRVTRCNRVLVRRHGHAHLALLEQRTPHRLLCLLAAWRRVDHLLRLEQKFIDTLLPVDWGTTAHAMHVVRIHIWHLGRINELIDYLLASNRSVIGRR